jgi:superfamily II DNA or RNA helicase
LINQGYLSPAYQFATDFDASQLDKKGRDYSEKSQTFAFTQKRVILNSFELWSQQAYNLKTLAFCASIEHSERMAEEFRMKGVNAYSLTSKNNAQRDYILKEFREGRIQVLFNCGILTTGYDEPSIECILLLRRTKSLPLYMQMCGRGSRIHTNKKHFFILDIAGNFFEHSLRWDDAVDWKTVFQNPKKSIAGVAPQKHCEECEFLFHASLMKCPSCGHEIAPRQAKEVIAELLNISQKDFDRKPEIELPSEVLNDQNLPARISNLRYIKLIRGYKEAWFFRQVWQKHGIQGLRFIEKELDYKKGWSSMMAKRYTTK